MSDPFVTLLAVSGVPGRYRAMTLQPGCLSIDEGCAVAAPLTSPGNSMAKWGERRWAMFVGAPGTGKTSWATALFNACVYDRFTENADEWLTDSRAKPMWVSEMDLYQRMDLVSGGDGIQARAAVVTRASMAPLLVLDDIGYSIKTATEYKRSALQYIINQRYNEERRTIITTALKMADLVTLFGEATTGRIIEMTGAPFVLGGPDRRRFARHQG